MRSKIKSAVLFRNEKWLPIINESGTVYGKTTYTQSLDKENEYLHPIIRIALIHNGKIFLCRKENIETNNQPCLDYPFERHILYKETLEESLTKTLDSYDINCDCNFLFHYIHRNEEMQRMVYFYICNVRDDSLLEKIDTCNGKWWTRKQIKENLKTGVFSDFFENEFEFLDSTVLTINK